MTSLEGKVQAVLTLKRNNFLSTQRSSRLASVDVKLASVGPMLGYGHWPISLPVLIFRKRVDVDLTRMGVMEYTCQDHNYLEAQPVQVVVHRPVFSNASMHCNGATVLQQDSIM